MSGPLSVPFALVAVYWPDPNVRLISAVAAFVCAIAAGYGLWSIERTRVRELEDRLLCKVRFFLPVDPTANAPGVEIARGPSGEELPHIQVGVEALTDAVIYDCVANIVRTEHRLSIRFHRGMGRDEARPVVSSKISTTAPFAR